jgi:hypothetical protein
MRDMHRVGALCHGFISRNLSITILAFVTYIRPILEYNSIVWNPNFIHLIDLIENEQRNSNKVSFQYRHHLTCRKIDAP